MLFYRLLSIVNLTFFMLAIWLTLQTAPVPGWAGVIVINNQGFEDPVLADGNTSGGSTPGWNRLGAATFLNPSATHFPGGNAPEGNNVATLGAGGSGAILFQNLAGTTLQYGTYTFQIDVGDRLDQGFHEVGFSFLINATTIVPLTSSSKPAVPDEEFRTWTYTYEVLSPTVYGGFIGDPTRIRFLASGSDGFFSIDNVRGNFVPVPEPSSLCLVAIPVACLIPFRLKNSYRQTEMSAKATLPFSSISTVLMAFAVLPTVVRIAVMCAWRKGCCTSS